MRDLRFLDESRFPDLTSDQREQFASVAAGPEIVSWMRLITWLVPRLDSLPKQIRYKSFAVLASLLNTAKLNGVDPENACRCAGTHSSPAK